MTAVPDDYDPPETTPQIGALRAYVDRREHADHDTFSMGREFAELLLAEYDRLLYLAEIKYELDGDEVAPETKWNRLVELSVWGMGPVS